jgi:hypothetical protein
MKKTTMLLTACGTTLGLASAAVAGAPFQLNISGATLLENLIESAGATNDWLDIDNDNQAGSLGSLLVDQLARSYDPNNLPTNFPGPDAGEPSFANYHWVVTYRAVGSINGLQELIDFGSTNLGPTFVTTDSVTDIVDTAATDMYWNRNRFWQGGGATVDNSLYESDNPGGLPTRQAFADFGALRTTDDNLGGIQIDFAPVDVPGAWAVIAPGATFSPDLNPGDAGYGDNPRSATDALGADLAQGNKLADLGARTLFDPNNPGAADGDTLFDNPISFAPIAVLTNIGTGLQEISISQLKHTTGTGRLPSGENIMQCTRDSGSGTRNGYNNSIDQDPSWGVGENIGPKASDSSTDRLGPDFQPSNKGGSSRMEGAVTNHRLAIGYTGAERGVASSSNPWLLDKDMEVLAVINDIYGGSTANRPTIDNLLDNDAETGYRIGGPATLVSVGDPRSTLNDASVKGTTPGNTNPGMANPQAANYLNNITRSIENVVNIPNDPDNELQPGEVVAQLLVPPAALDFFFTNGLDPQSWGPNPDLNQSLQNEIRSISVLGDPAYATFDTSHAGRVPTRTSGTGITYSDGVANGANYVDQDGNAISYADLLTLRNRIAGDFNGDGARDWNDAEDMMRAFNERNGGSAWIAPGGIYGASAGADAIIEVLGDFTGDGNFDASDIRYWADGLAVDPAIRDLDRVQGFTRVDTAWALVGGTKNPGGFFNTSLANINATYDAGAARADVAGTGAGTPGWVPTGSNGSVGAEDIDYVYAQFVGNDSVSDGSLDRSDYNEALSGDLSCDIDGNLSVNIDDVCEILAILETSYGDVNLDGVVDSTDISIAQGNIDTPGGWADGDVNGDGTVDQTDVDVITEIAGGDNSNNPCVPTPACVGDVNGDGVTDVFDFSDLAANFGAGPAATREMGDLTGDGYVDAFDFAELTADFGCGP